MARITVEGVAKAKAMLKKVVDDELDALSTTLASEIRKRTPIDTGRARSGWQKRKDEVRNEVPYIRRLENGYSSQARRGFTQQAVTATVNKRKTK